MTLAACLFGAALAIASPTNAPSSFSTEAERTFSVPDLIERNVWLDCRLDFAATASNRVEIAIGPDVDGDGVLDDSEAPVAFAIDCGRLVVCDGKGNELFSAVNAEDVVRLSLLPAKGEVGDAWRINHVDGTQIAAGTFVEGDPSLKTWNLARVRMNGPTASFANVRLQKNRLATVFVVR